MLGRKLGKEKMVLFSKRSEMKIFKPRVVACMVVFSLVQGLSPAQVERNLKPGSGKSREVLKRLKKNFQEKRHRAISLNVQVEVLLKNGERISGIVKQGRFVERENGLDFVPADKKVPGAGIRIWYYNNTSSYIFIMYKYIKSYKIIKRLSDLEVKEIGRKIRNEEKRRAELSRKRARERIEAIKRREKREELEKKLEKLAKKLEKQEKEARARAERARLLKEFPPEEGWGPERIKEINLRKIALHVYPNEKERRFIEVFEQWMKAYEEAKRSDKLEKDLKESLKGEGKREGKKGS